MTTLQPYHVFNATRHCWAEEPYMENVRQPGAITKIAIYSWVMNSKLPEKRARVSAALDHLRDMIANAENGESMTAPVIFLQECSFPAALQEVCDNQWVRDRFNIAGMNSTSTARTYCGIVMLLDRCLTITSCFRRHLHESHPNDNRSALFVELVLGSDENKKRVCLCNTQLNPYSHMYRQPQASRIIRSLGSNDDEDIALLAGDLKATLPEDSRLYVDRGFKDAFLEHGGVEGSEEGHTWGKQNSVRFGPVASVRVSRIYFRGPAKLLEFSRFGEDVQLPEGPPGSEMSQRRVKLMRLGYEKPWITDCFGLMATFEIISRGGSLPPNAAASSSREGGREAVGGRPFLRRSWSW